MIRFSCKCASVLEVPADQAGLTVQCPECGRLNDVPNLGDLANLDQDGGYKIGAAQLRNEPNRLADLNQAFSRDRSIEIDMRGPVGAGPVQGADYPDAPPLRLEGGPPPGIEIPLAEEAEPAPTPRPRYDPETGELIVALDVKPPAADPPPPKPLPMATLRDLTAEDLANSPQGLTVLLELFRPLNLLVVGICAIAISFLFASMLGGMMVRFCWGASFFLLALVFSHIANVIEDTGPLEKDELPRPLRDVNLGEDYWHPFGRVFLSLLAAYLPYMMWTGMPILTWLADAVPAAAPVIDAARAPVQWGLLGLGTLFFPAILLTLCTSGGVINLRPDRVIGVVRCAGFVDYPAAVLLWTAVMFLGNVYTGLIMPISITWFLIILLMIAPVIYSILAHGLGWLLGSIYRRHHDEFPWAYQVAEHRQHFGFPVMRAPRSPAPPPPTLGFAVGPVAPPPKPAQAPAWRKREVR